MIIVTVWCLNLHRNSNEISIKTPVANNNMPSQQVSSVDSAEHKSSSFSDYFYYFFGQGFKFCKLSSN
jgi:hypothetical protein